MCTSSTPNNKQQHVLAHLCATSSLHLLTGLYSQRTGLAKNIPTVLRSIKTGQSKRSEWYSHEPSNTYPIWTLDEPLPLVQIGNYFFDHVEVDSRAVLEDFPSSANPRVIFTMVLALTAAVAIGPSLHINKPVAPVACQVILEPGIGQFSEFEPRRVHTRIIRWDFFLCTK